jgi:beta-N-acetylhexosaminidase
MQRLLKAISIVSIMTMSLCAVRLPLANAEQDIATDLLEAMTPEERIGQLFLVTFTGSKIEDGDAIYDLVVTHRISGIILSRDNGNFIDAPESIGTARDLITSIQKANYESSAIASIEDSETEQPEKPVYVPLFIAISQDCNNGPCEEILPGLSYSPTLMAIGATWDPSLARDAGEVLGEELEAIGINLLLGPSLDVLEDPRLRGTGDLGVRSFGGDPFWVGVMGEAYIEGVHQGSNDRMAVVAKHFPGLGGSDRPLEEEVATVRKSLEQLKQIELAPFFVVTDMPPGDNPSIVDGLLTSHIRYQGFQGNIRATTRPVSLDRTAYDQLMALEPFMSWRDAGGVTISDSLGSRAIRRFIDSIGQSFQGNLVAKDAFLAGNDMMILSDFQEPHDEDEITTILSTLEFFAQKYREDDVFAQRVDEAVLRILNLKLRLYNGHFAFDRVISPEEELNKVGKRNDVAVEIARRAATLISPSDAAEIGERFGDPPGYGTRVAFFTDTRKAATCENCPERTIMDIRDMENAVLRLYGSKGTGQIYAWQLFSFQMADLEVFLGEPIDPNPLIPLVRAEEVDEAINSANWLVFSIQESSPDIYGSSALKKLLDERPDLARAKHIIVFSYDVPYDLDATYISKIDGYYALYSTTPPFIDQAARLLFQEIAPTGASPVSVPGIGYDLIDITAPDPDQAIPLSLLSENILEIGEGGIEELAQGDLVQFETGTILDKNGHQVPDGTPVDFIISDQAENIPPFKIQSITNNGKARINLSLDRAGVIMIRVESSLARNSQIIQINIQEGEAAEGTISGESLTGGVDSSPTPTEASPTATAIQNSGQNMADNDPKNKLGAIGLALGLIGLALGGVADYALSSLLKEENEFHIRRFMIIAICGLISYNYIAIGFKGSEIIRDSMGLMSGFVLAVAGSMIGLAIVRIMIVLRYEEYLKE